VFPPPDGEGKKDLTRSCKRVHKVRKTERLSCQNGNIAVEEKIFENIKHKDRRRFLKKGSSRRTENFTQAKEKESVLDTHNGVWELPTRVRSILWANTRKLAGEGSKRLKRGPRPMTEEESRG